MNAYLTFKSSEIAVRKPTRLTFIVAIEAFFSFLFATADDPAVLRYAAGKYGAEID
jgi:hypothetical protein